MNKLKAKIKIYCNTCGCTMTRTKTIKVSATNKEDAIKEASQKIESWRKSLNGKNCKQCQTIIDQDNKLRCEKEEKDEKRN